MRSALCALIILGSSVARAQSGIRLEGGFLDLAEGPGILVGLPVGQLPVSVEGAVGRAVGGSLSLAWPRFGTPFGNHEIWFVSGGVSLRLLSRRPGTERGSYNFVAGMRIPYSPEGGPVFEMGGGYFRTFGGTTNAGYTGGITGRIAIGWQF